VEEGANDVGMAAQSTDREADTSLQDVEVRRAQAAQGVLFQPRPEPFIGVQFRGVGREAKHAQAGTVSGQSLARSAGAVGVAAIPQQEQGRGNPSQQVTDKTDHLVAGDGARDQMQIGMRIRRDGGNRRQLGPVETVTQDGGLSARRPGTAGGREQ
jgi:hypothetical protein